MPVVAISCGFKSHLPHDKGLNPKVGSFCYEGGEMTLILLKKFGEIKGKYPRVRNNILMSAFIKNLLRRQNQLYDNT